MSMTSERVGGLRTTAVNQHQVAVGAEAAQVEGRGARVLDALLWILELNSGLWHRAQTAASC